MQKSLLGARHFLERMIDDGDGLGGEAVVDSDLGLVRDGLGRVPRGQRKGQAR